MSTESERAKQGSQAVWGSSPAGSTHALSAEPGTQEFFDRVMERRTSYEMPWLWEVIPLGEFDGREVLEVGCGAGYDAFSIMQAGAHYSGIDITPQNIDRTRRHLAFYGLEPSVQQGDAEHLPFGDGTFDVVFSNGVLHHTPDMNRAFSEIARVLRPGGKFFILVYNNNSVFYRLSLMLFDHIAKLNFLKESAANRLARIEFTNSTERPLVRVLSRRELRVLLRDSGLAVSGISIRKLLLEDMPHIPLVERLWPRIPQRTLDRVGERFGWYLVATGTKPIP